MKNKQNNFGFTFAEMLIVLVIIGIIAALMIANMGDKVDKNKAMFKKAYSLTERTVVELVNDETLYPYNLAKFGFLEDTNVQIPGTEKCTDGTNYTNNKCTNATVNLRKKFYNLFSNNINTTDKSDTNYTFTSTDGVDWEISDYITTPVKGFMITIDVNGEKDPNKPSSVNNVADDKEGETPNRDKFYVYVRADGKLELPTDDNIAKSYLKSANFQKEEN